MAYFCKDQARYSENANDDEALYLDVSVEDTSTIYLSYFQVSPQAGSVALHLQEASLVGAWEHREVLD